MRVATTADTTLPESARDLLERFRTHLRKLPRRPRIVFPEGHDSRVQEAVGRLAEEGLVDPVLLSSDGPPEEYADLYYARRGAKGVSREQAASTARDPLYHAALMVAAGDADAGVGGAANTTADTVRAALQCIGLAKGVRTISSCFLMCVRDRRFGCDGVLAFADGGIVIDPDVEQLTEVAMETAANVRVLLEVEPRVAMLSFSTRGSASHAHIDKVTEATRRIRERAPELLVDGELQADAALVAAIGASKAPGSPVAGRANTLIFPDLTSANIAYKLVERLGDAAAFGPLLQGLAKPFHDLSRGCSAEDVYAVGLIAGLQSVGGTAGAIERAGFERCFRSS
ncbi:MAG: phosphate acyltransferase [Bryobacteraceae bacterium]